MTERKREGMMAERFPLIAGNWKMNKTIEEAKALVEALLPQIEGVEYCEVALCPPFTALTAVAELIDLSEVHLGAQNCAWEESGEFTGEVSPAMLKEIGCTYVILGHSERRRIFAETDEMINKKVLAALRCDLDPILCIGETREEREANRTNEVVQRQLRACLKDVTPEQVASIVIAYEPVWAIGKAALRAATPEEAQEVHAFIRRTFGLLYDEVLADSLCILYGGSVKPDNIKELMAQADIDGALVGGASLKAESFARIVRFRD
jgi:triosephosphate isomerase